MTAPPLKKPVATCRAKRRHPDELTARAAAMRCIEMHGIQILYVYPCQICHGWHLTKRHQGNARKVTADNPIHDRRA